MAPQKDWNKHHNNAKSIGKDCTPSYNLEVIPDVSLIDWDVGFDIRYVAEQIANNPERGNTAKKTLKTKFQRISKTLFARLEKDNSNEEEEGVIKALCEVAVARIVLQIAISTFGAGAQNPSGSKFWEALRSTGHVKIPGALSQSAMCDQFAAEAKSVNSPTQGTQVLYRKYGDILPNGSFKWTLPVETVKQLRWTKLFQEALLKYGIFQLYSHGNTGCLENKPNIPQASWDVTHFHCDHVGNFDSKKSGLIPKAYKELFPEERGMYSDNYIQSWMVEQGTLAMHESTLLVITALTKDPVKIARQGRMTLMRMHGGTAEAEFHSRDITLNQGDMLFLMCDCLHANRKPVTDVSTASHRWHWVFGSSQSQVTDADCPDFDVDEANKKLAAKKNKKLKKVPLIVDSPVADADSDAGFNVDEEELIII